MEIDNYSVNDIFLFLTIVIRVMEPILNPGIEKRKGGIYICGHIVFCIVSGKMV